MTERVTALQGIWRQVCPRCRQGPLFRRPLLRGPVAMHERCRVCGLKFEREPGYFVGAMYVSYALTLPPALILFFVIRMLSPWTFNIALVATFAVSLPLVPFVMRMARVLWIYFDRRIDPD
jgi:uncharacterized protein (DUF983 family)